ncbi:MAG: hypothetical protein ABI591_01200 [Kofleriaceae bacterium]
MRILPTALVASVAIHTGAITWAVSHELETPAVVTVTAPPIEVVIVAPAKARQEPQELVVALLDDHTVATMPQATTRETRALAPHATGRISTGRSGPTEVAPAPPHSSIMTMRGPDKKILKGPSDAFWQKFDDNTRPLQPSDLEGERIADDVAREAEHLNNPRWIANATPEQAYEEREHQVASREEQANHELQQDGRGTKAEHATFTGHVDPDGTAHLDQKRRYDPTEILMHRNNIDPYASNKRRFLDGTREERYQIGKQYKEQQLAHSSQIAQHNLEYLWAKTTDTNQRKQALFEMWDECAETGSEKLVAGGASARLIIVGFIRGHMTGAASYTAAELVAFNAKKKSSAVFDPYKE